MNSSNRNSGGSAVRSSSGNGGTGKRRNHET
jgi:hypothetical protein